MTPTGSDPAAPGTARRPRVFISYAHESDAHVEAVRDLYVALRAQGVDARLDLPAAERRQDWPLWMQREVRAADYVLVVASPEYRRRAEGDAEPAEGRGVQYEAAVIREELYRDREAGLLKLLPVVLPGMSVDDVPVWLGPTTTTSYRVEDLTPSALEQLIRVVTGQPREVEPPLGEIPNLPSRAAGLGGVPSPRLPVPPHDLVLEVSRAHDRLHCRVTLAGALLGEREGRVPFGTDDAWRTLEGPPAAADARLAEVGEHAAASDEPLGKPTTAPAGTGVRELRIGDLIGRRHELRTTLSALRGGRAALDRWGARAGVVLLGVGGIGKTAVAGRVMARLATTVGSSLCTRAPGIPRNSAGRSAARSCARGRPTTPTWPTHEPSSAAREWKTRRSRTSSRIPG